MSLRSVSIAKNFNKEHEKLFHAVLSSSSVFNVNLPRGQKKISHLAVVSRIDRRVLSLFRTTTVVRECVRYLRIGCAHFKTSLTSSPIFPLIQPEQLIIALCPPPPSHTGAKIALLSFCVFVHPNPFTSAAANVAPAVRLYFSCRTSPIFHRSRNTSAFLSDASDVCHPPLCSLFRLTFPSFQRCYSVLIWL